MDRANEAREAYLIALQYLDQALDDTSSQVGQPTGAPSPRGTAHNAPGAAVWADYAELFGMRGGVLRRLGRLLDALESYRRGAEIERRWNLAATYNRGNAVKLSLISGESTVADAREDLLALRNSIETTLTNDPVAAQDAWMWADLGDTQLLLGDYLAAADAYREFIAKARTDSPTTMFSVLYEIAAALRNNHDPDVGRVAGDLDRVVKLLRRPPRPGTEPEAG
jgi:tetratricopeptide (TPR) repeat protein